MRTENLFVTNGTGKEAFTEMARVLESIRMGTKLPDGRCLMDELSESEKSEVETFIMKKLMPEIREASRAKSRKLELNYDKESTFHSILVEWVYREFHKFNKAAYLSDKEKVYELSSFIDMQAKAAFRDFLIEDRGLPVNTIQNMSLVSAAVADIVMGRDISPKDVTSEMVYEFMGKEKQISKEMIDIIFGLLTGNVSIEQIQDFDKMFADETSDFVDDIKLDMDPYTKAKLDAVFATFSDLELFILMKEFGFLGGKIGSMTAKEISYQDYFVNMVRSEKLGLKHIEYGSVRVVRPGRNSGAKEELLVENVYFVEDRYYNNKMLKIRKKLAALSKKVDKDDVAGCLEDYCINLWYARGLDKLFK